MRQTINLLLLISLLNLGFCINGQSKEEKEKGQNSGLKQEELLLLLIANEMNNSCNVRVVGSADHTIEIEDLEKITVCGVKSNPADKINFQNKNRKYRVSGVNGSVRLSASNCNSISFPVFVKFVYTLLSENITIIDSSSSETTSSIFKVDPSRSYSIQNSGGTSGTFSCTGSSVNRSFGDYRLIFERIE